MHCDAFPSSRLQPSPSLRARAGGTHSFGQGACPYRRELKEKTIGKKEEKEQVASRLVVQSKKTF